MSIGWRSRWEGCGKYDILKSRVCFEFIVDVLYYYYIELMILNIEGGLDDIMYFLNDVYIVFFC